MHQVNGAHSGLARGRRDASSTDVSASVRDVQENASLSLRVCFALIATFNLGAWATLWQIVRITRRLLG